MYSRNRALIFFLSLGLPITSWAQESLPEAAEDAAPTVDVLEAELLALQAALQAQIDDYDQLDALIDAASTLTDRDTAEAEKLAAVAVMADIGDARAIPFFLRAAEQGTPAVKLALLSAAPVFAADERIHRMVIGSTERLQVESVRLAGIVALDAVAVPEAPELLMSLASSRDESQVVRDAARRQLELEHAEFLRQQGGIQIEAPPLQASAAVLFTGTSGLVGGMMLSSIGRLGQTAAGPGLGAVGGALIGGGTGLLYANSSTPSPADALQYTNATIWGGVYGAQADTIAGTEDGTLYMMTAGSVVGAGLGLMSMSAFEADSGDFVEQTGAMLVGNQLLAGVARWSDASDEVRVGASMIGQSVGAVAGLAVRETVEIDAEDTLLITSAGVAGIWSGVVVPKTLGMRPRDTDGIVQTALPASVLAGAVLAELRPIPAQQVLAADYGFLCGNLLGGGLPQLLMEEPSSRLISQAVLVGGLSGAISGARSHSRFSLDAGDTSLIAVGTTLATTEAAAISYVLYNKHGIDRHSGIVMTTAGASALGLAVASQRAEVEPGVPLLAGSAAGWGVFYGGLVPVVLGMEGEPEDLLPVIILTSDVFIGAALLSQLSSIDLNPRATVLPQLGGIGGSVVGTLGTALLSSDRQAIAAGSLVGSAAGAVVGIGLEKRYGSQWIPRADILPDVRLVSAPVVIDREESGLTFGLVMER